MNPQRKVLITGASGYVGSNVARKFVKLGWAVDVIVRPSSNLNLLKDLDGLIGIHVFKGGIEAAIELMSLSKPDVVIHIAAEVKSEHKPKDVDRLLQGNIVFGGLLLEAMTQVNVENFINTGTYWEHYQSKTYSPVNLYAASKFCFQNILQFYTEAKGINAITLKLFDPYGPNDPRPKLINLLIQCAKTGETLKMSPGEQKIDLVHIDDVAMAYVQAALSLFTNVDTGHECYRVASGDPKSLRQIVELLQRLMEVTINVEWGARPYRSREVMEPPANFDLLPGWSPSMSIENGLREIIPLG
jgi:nucleoside-diphosphate-sugar epimerase